MAYENRDLVRVPICMLRGSKEEEEKLLRLAKRLSNGGSTAVALRDALLKLADEMEHERNPISFRQLDRKSFGAMCTA
ncbi:hypothetical protein [Comamonas sp. 4034]|uniref:hypothetical protein n=1 Tax=Comamonas sp. 4034 TaxID=3156455 RepID=UPI003D19C2A2